METRLYRSKAASSFVAPPVVAGQVLPWTFATADDDSFALANIGQAKQLFSFDFTADADGDGIVDVWELRFSTDLSLIGGTLNGQPRDSDGDGFTDVAEFTANTSAVDPAPSLSVTSPSGASLIP